MSASASITQYTGQPREPEPVPLENARALRIRQVIDRDGALCDDLPEPDLSREQLRYAYESMHLVREIDDAGWKLQRSGRIMFWIPIRGQEAVQVGPVLAMRPQDWIFRAHRELAVWFMRGLSLTSMFAQFFGADADTLRGRRLPCLVGSRAINLVASTTQVGTFIAHAAGVGWAARLQGRDINTLSYFGDGATSRGEFHSAMNFAGIHKPRVVFLCVNNSWAVTTPMTAQTAMPDIASKGDAYGVRNVRVDGNDPLALYAVTRDAIQRMDSDGPTLIEAVTYRVGYHTSSDNPDLYRQEAECQLWAEWDPLLRMRRYLERKGFWSDADQSALAARCSREVREAIQAAEAMPLPRPEGMFDDVYAEPDWILRQQRERILADLATEAR